MALLPFDLHRFHSIQQGEIDEVGWALGIFESGDINAG